MIIACVRTGTKYPVDYVYRLKAMVERHLKVFHKFICITDRPNELKGIEVIDITALNLPGWWGKMYLFELFWRAGEKVIYFDLDTVICNDIKPLTDLEIEFGICANFTRAYGIKEWPCKYGSCVMVLGKDLDCYIWDIFCKNKETIIRSVGQYGDQSAIEQIAPDATLLQDVLPKGFFIGYRELKDFKPPATSVVVFAGTHKPDNCNEEWIRKEWALS